MPPPDASTDAGTNSAPRAGSSTEDTLDLRLSDELVALFGDDGPATGPPAAGGDILDTPPTGAPSPPPPASSSSFPYASNGTCRSSAGG